MDELQDWIEWKRQL